jgi:ADP-heptose:LPS heptosyltransferase
MRFAERGAKMSNVLLVRSDGIGDALALVPLVAALRGAGHDVGAVLSTRNAETFSSTALDRTHVLARRPWPAHGSTSAEYAAAVSDVRSAGYDIALVASEEPEMYRLARDARIPQRIGFTNGLEKPLKSVWARAQLTRAVVRPASPGGAHPHEVETMFALGHSLMYEPEPTRDVARLRPLVVDGLPSGVSQTLVLQLSPKFADRGIDRLAYVAIANALRADGAEVVAYASSGDRVFAEAFVFETGIEVTIGAPVVAWKDAIASARAVVTPDCGAAHVAGMLGIPTIVLFPPSTHVARDIARWSPWAAPHRALIATPGNPDSTATAVADALRELFETP